MRPEIPLPERAISDTVTHYFKGVKTFPLLTRARLLWQKGWRKDSDARKQMIEANLRLVISIAKKS